MAWTTTRQRFAGALILFLIWVAALAALARVSSYRPAAHSAPPTSPRASVQPVSEPTADAESTHETADQK